MIEFYYHPDGDVPDVERRACEGCRHCQGAVSLWCVNDEATEYRGTRIPDVYHCKFWSPMKAARWVKRIWPLKPRLVPNAWGKIIVTTLKTEEAIKC